MREISMITNDIQLIDSQSQYSVIIHLEAISNNDKNKDEGVIEEENDNTNVKKKDEDKNGNEICEEEKDVGK